MGTKVTFETNGILTAAAKVIQWLKSTMTMVLANILYSCQVKSSLLDFSLLMNVKEREMDAIHVQCAEKSSLHHSGGLGEEEKVMDSWTGE